MTRLKAVISLLLVFVLILSSTACGNKSADNSFSSYVGIWSESNLSWDFGGITLEISIENEEMLLDCRLTQGAPQSRVAQFTHSIKMSEIKDNNFTVNYEDDNWGNSGSIEFTFGKDYILADFKEVVQDDSIPVWGFCVSTYKLVRNDNAYKLLEYTMDDYEQKYSEDDIGFYDPSTQGTVTQPMYTFPTTNTTTTPRPSYDLSKASGILASMGMSEEEFKKSCIPLTSELYPYYNYSNFTTVCNPDSIHLAEGKKYFKQNPNDTAVELETQKWKEICADYESGGTKYRKEWSAGITWGSYHLYEKYETLENYLNDVVYAPKGYSILSEYTKVLFSEMLEYPDKYIGKAFVLAGFDISSDLGETYIDDFYMRKTVVVNDLRDNPNNPNILSDKYYNFYVIFNGFSSGYNYNFSLIAIEKTQRW